MDRALSLPGTPRARPLALPRLREDLRLENASANRDGSPSWMIHDPARNRFFRIGWLEFELLVRWDTRDAEALASRVRSETPLEPDANDVAALVLFLEHHQLLHAASARDTARLAGQRRLSDLGMWHHLLHGYLFSVSRWCVPSAFSRRRCPTSRFCCARPPSR